MYPMIHYTQSSFSEWYFFFPGCLSFWVFFKQWVITPSSPPGQSQPHRFLKLPCILILLSKMEIPRDSNSPFAIPQNSFQLCYHGLVTAGIQGLGTSW